MVFCKQHLFLIVFILTGFFSYSQPYWSQVIDSTAFEPRDSSPNASVVHNGEVYILEGYRHEDNGQWESRSDVWKSSDGINWTLINPSPPYFPYCAFVSFKGKIWAYGAESFSSTDGIAWAPVATNQVISYSSRATVHNNAVYIISDKSVMKTTNGIDFEVINENAPWESRNRYGLVSFKGKLWFFGGGINYFTGNDFYYRDIWSSQDGVTWKLEATDAEWPGRYWFAYHVFDQKIWLTGGWDYYKYINTENGNLNDTWYTENGRDWVKLPTDTVYQNRHASFLWCRDGFLWLSSGYGGGGDPTMYNDVWKVHLPNQYIETETNKITLAYGDTVPVPANSAVGLPLTFTQENPETIIVSNGFITGLNIGNTTLTIEQKSGGCEYAYSRKVINVQVEKRVVTVTPKNKNIYFGDSAPPVTLEYTNLAFNHTADSLLEQPHPKPFDAEFFQFGEHVILLEGGNDPRYTFNLLPGKLTVYPSNLTSYFIPNPASDYVTPVVPLGEIQKVIIYDSRGASVLTRVPNEFGQIEIDDMVSGIYLVRILTVNKIFTSSLVVIR